VIVATNAARRTVLRRIGRFRTTRGATAAPAATPAGTPAASHSSPEASPRPSAISPIPSPTAAPSRRLAAAVDVVGEGVVISERLVLPFASKL